MRGFLTASFLLFLAFFSTVDAAASPVLAVPEVRDGRIIIKQGGENVTIPDTILRPDAVENANLQYAVSSDEEGKPFGLADGLYVFEQNGKLAGFAPQKDIYACAFVSLSPGGKFLAVDSGTFVVRALEFFSYPDIQPVKNTSAVYLAHPDRPAFLWINNEEILFTAIDEESERVCAGSPCGPTSIMRYSIASGKAEPVLKGTLLCDYALLSFEGATVTAAKLCLPDSEAWKTYSGDEPQEQITIKLP